jgi:hypothetical protein
MGHRERRLVGENQTGTGRERLRVELCRRLADGGVHHDRRAVRRRDFQGLGTLTWGQSQLGSNFGESTTMLARLDDTAQRFLRVSVRIVAGNGAVEVDQTPVHDIETEVALPARSMVENLLDRRAADQPDPELHQIDPSHRTPHAGHSASRFTRAHDTRSVREPAACGHLFLRERRRSQVNSVRGCDQV